MAEITEQIKIAVDAGDSAKSIREMSKALKELVALQGQVGSGTDDFKRLSKAINEAEGKIGDLNDSFSTLKGSGVERLNSSLGLLREGLLSADPEKLSIGFNGLKAAMSAVPIFLVIQGLQYLYENFDAVKSVIFGTTDESKMVTEQFKALKQQTEENKKALEDYLTTLNLQLETLALTNAPLREQLALRQKITDTTVADLDKQISKKNEDISSTQKQIDANNKLLESQRLVAATSGAGELQYRDQIKATNEALNIKIKTQKKELEELEQTQTKRTNVIAKGVDDQKKLIESAEKEAERIRKANEDAVKNADDAAERSRDKQSANIASINSELKKNSNDRIEDAKNTNKEVQDLEDQTSDFFNKSNDKQIKKYEDNNKKKLDVEKKTQAAIIQLTQEATQIIGQLLNSINEQENKRLENQSELNSRAKDERDNQAQADIDAEKEKADNLLKNDDLTADQRESIQKKTEENKTKILQNAAIDKYKIDLEQYKVETDIRKKQFERDKAFRIANATIDTAGAIIRFLVDPGGDAGVALSVAAGILGLAQIALISSQKFDAGVEPATPNFNIKGVASNESSVQTNSFNPNRTILGLSTNSNLDDNGRVNNSDRSITVKAYVVESDLTSTQKRLKTIENSSSLSIQEG